MTPQDTRDRCCTELGYDPARLFGNDRHASDKERRWKVYAAMHASNDKGVKLTYEEIAIACGCSLSAAFNGVRRIREAKGG